MRLLVTCPGKLGDLLNCLPVVVALGRQLDAQVSLMTSPACRAAAPLLAAQPYLAQVRLDRAYQPEHDRCGLQPWRMAEPPGYDRVLHLGLRPELVGREVMNRPLAATFARNLSRAYGLEVKPDQDKPFLILPPQPRGEHLAFNGWGQTFGRLAGPQVEAYLRRLWPALLAGAGRPVLAACGPDDAAWHQSLGLAVAQPPDLLALARLIQGAAAFVGVESLGAAVANGLKSPSLVLDYFGTGLPTGPGAASFRLDEQPAAIAAKLDEVLAGASG